jgi:phytanoyl-CoA hydroxylase
MWAAPGENGLVLKTLWTDTPYAMQRVDGMFQAGSIDQQERDDLSHFIEHGWLLWRKAIEPELIDAFASDVRRHHESPGKFVTTDHRRARSQLKLSGSAPERFESLFDLYVNLESARAVCFHPRICNFLALVFDTPPVACQQLLFQRSNGHQVHQDTSVVCVDDPLLLAATWIALEDVVEGSGELAWYDRSHRLPHYLFKDGSKRLSFGVDDQEAYQQELDRACRERGYEYQRFLATKGDVFFWTADLVHRSHPRRLPEDTSRLSCVTHYYPDTTMPFWFRHHPDRTARRAYGDSAHYVSIHYPLDGGASGMIEPDSPWIAAVSA